MTSIFSIRSLTMPLLRRVWARWQMVGMLMLALLPLPSMADIVSQSVQSSAAQNPAVSASSRQALQQLAGQITQDCAIKRERTVEPTDPRERALWDMGQHTACECLPERIATLNDPALITPLLAGGMQRIEALAPLRAACGVQGLRQSLPTLCRLDAAQKPRAAAENKICDCIEQSVSQVSDEALAIEAKQAYADFTARGRTQGQASTRQGLFEKIAQDCRR